MPPAPHTRLPTIGGRNSQLNTARSQNTDRFTKLKGVLVNNLLKEYHKQTHRQGDELVYNRAVTEVDKILQNGRLTEQQLVELQQNFAKGVMIEPPQRRGPSKHKNSTAAPPTQDIKGTVPIHHAGGGQGDAERPEEAPPASKSVMNDAASVADSTATENSPSKRRRAVDEWSIITLYNDVKHYDEQKNLKDRQAHDKMKTRQELQQQMEARKLEKEARKQAEQKAAQEQQSKYEQWKAERQRQEQLRQAKILAERDKEAQELQRLADLKKARAEQDLREQQAMLDGFQKQIQEEKDAKDRALMEKQKQYQQMLIENSKVLERKRLAKEQEREENLRLFQLQIEMADKQDRIRAEREAERQRKLKSAEQMAGDLNDRAAQLEAELNQRVQRAQEEHRKKDIERERAKRDKKKAMDQETAAVLQEQVKEREKRRVRDAEEQKLVAERFRKDADAYAKIKSEEKMVKAQQQRQVKDMLNQQLMMKEMRKQAEGGMSGVELRMNAHLLKQVLHDGPEVPEELMNKLNSSPAMHEEHRPADPDSPGKW